MLNGFIVTCCIVFLCNCGIADDLASSLSTCKIVNGGDSERAVVETLRFDADLDFDGDCFYTKLEPMLGASFGEEKELLGSLQMSAQGEPMLQFMHDSRPSMLFVACDEMLLKPFVGSKVRIKGYESLREMWPFEQRWMYNMFVIPVMKPVSWRYRRIFVVTSIERDESRKDNDVKKISTRKNVITPLLGPAFGMPIYAVGTLHKVDKKTYCMKYRYPRVAKNEKVQIRFDFGDGGCFSQDQANPKRPLKVNIDDLCDKEMSFVGIESVAENEVSMLQDGSEKMNTVEFVRRYTIVSIPGVINYSDCDWYFIDRDIRP